MLHFLYSKTKTIHSKHLSPKEEHRVTKARVTPHTAAIPGVEGVQFLTPHIHNDPWTVLSRTWGQDTVNLELN